MQKTTQVAVSDEGEASPLSFSLPKLAPSPSQPSTTTSSVLRLRKNTHSRQPSSSLKSVLRPEESHYDDFALGEYRKQEIVRARGPFNCRWSYWYIDSWQEDAFIGDKKSSFLPEHSQEAEDHWEAMLSDQLRLRKYCN